LRRDEVHSVLLDRVAQLIDVCVVRHDLPGGALVEAPERDAPVDRHVDEGCETPEISAQRSMLSSSDARERPECCTALIRTAGDVSSVRSSRGVVKSSSVLPYSMSRPTRRLPRA